MMSQAGVEIPRRRDALAASGRLWKGPRGRHLAEPGFAMTLSCEQPVDYNVAICHAPAAEVIRRALAEVDDSGSPALIMLAGAALGAARTLSDAGWVPVGTVPFMSLSISSGGLDGSVRRLDLAGLPVLRSHIEEAFGLPPLGARLAVPDSAAIDAHDADPAFAGWGLYQDDQMVAGLETVFVNDNVCIWSMATPPGLQHRGYGRRLLTGVLAQCSIQGAETCLLIASTPGEPLYLSMGFAVVEYWQVWSRPRWVLA